MRVFPLVVMVSACGPSAPVHPLTDEPLTTLQAAWAPLAPSDEVAAQLDAGELLVTDLGSFAAAGLGVERVPGAPWIDHRELAPNHAEGPAGARRSLLYLWQAADPQLIDEESPIRFEAFTPLYRPQGHLTLQVFESHVRTAARISSLSGRPFDVALLAGDLTDGSQHNELQWFLTALNGGELDPDSGVDDDPVPGEGNDYNDPLWSDGLGVPWLAAIGNHETQYNGGFGEITDELRAASVADTVFDSGGFPNGYRDGSTVYGDVVAEGDVVADEDRRVLGLEEVLSELFEAGGRPSGHGLTAEGAAAGVGYFSAWPVSDRPLRVIVLNTVNSYGGLGLGESGWLDVEQFGWLQGELAAADAAHELVVLMSHHRAADLLRSSPVSADELTGALAASDGLVLHVTGHGHNNAKRLVLDPLAAADAGYWELMLASTVDFPMHSRVIELVDEGNGYLSIYVTNLDHDAPEGSLAHEGRELAAAKRVFSSFLSPDGVEQFWAEDLVSQNLLLRVPISAAIQARLAEESWPERVESVETLLAFGD